MTRKCLKKKPASTITTAYPSPYIIKLNNDKDNNQGKADAQAKSPAQVDRRYYYTCQIYIN